MKKPIIIEGIVVIAVVIIGIVAYIALAGNSAIGDNAAGVAKSSSLDAGVNPPEVLSGLGPVASISTGNDGTLYAFTGVTGNDVSAIDRQFNLKWNYTVPEGWRVLNAFANTALNPAWPPFSGTDEGATWLKTGFGSPTIKPVFSVDNGVLYLYVRENKTTEWNHLPGEDHPAKSEAGDWKIEERLLAISNGKLLWDVPISHEHHVYEDTSVTAKNGRVYVFDDYSVTALDSGGSVLFKISNVSSAPSVDENGYVYIVPSVVLDPQPLEVTDYRHDSSGYQGPANVVEAYYPDGTLYWRINITDPIIQPGYCSLPLYQNGTLWVPVVNGVWALDVNGSVRWTKHYSGWAELYQTMPLDTHDNLYVDQYTADPDPQKNANIIHIIARNGSELNRTQKSYSASSADVQDGIIYCTQTFTRNIVDANGIVITLDMLPGVEMTTYDLINDRVLWNRTITPNGTESLITDENAGKLVDPWLPDKNTIMGSGIYMDWSGSSTAPYAMNPASVITGNDTVYVVYQAANYEWPIVIGKTKVDYAGKIYAFDKMNGTLLWEKSMSSKVTSVAVNNSSIFYGTRDGKVIVQQVGNVAGGAAVAALAYFFIRFFCIGAVSRARGRLDKNDNRKRVMEFIVKNPGSTLYEMAQALGMNVGTVRYHLFILSLNHKIVSNKADGKFIRFFTNSGAYGSEEQYIMSMVKRDGMGRVLGTLLEKPGLSNGELSKELKMRESNVSRYIGELVTKGIVIKNSRPDGMSSFSINNVYKDHVAFAIGRING